MVKMVATSPGPTNRRNAISPFLPGAVASAGAPPGHPGRADEPAERDLAVPPRRGRLGGDRAEQRGQDDEDGRDCETHALLLGVGLPDRRTSRQAARL